MLHIRDIIEKNLGIETLKPGKYQPRKHFDASYISKLADSIKHDGILEPLIVRSTANKNIYEIVAGECRWRAAQIAGLFAVPCRIGNYTNEQACRIALIENTTRANLNLIEEAEGIARLIEEFSYTHEKVSQALSMPRTEVTNCLRLLKLHPSVIVMLREGKLNFAQGKILAGIKIPDQYYFATECVKNSWSSRELDKAIKNFYSKQSQHNSFQHTVSKKNPDVSRLERNLSDHLGTQVILSEAGYIKIKCVNFEIMEGVFEKMGYKEHI